MLLNVHSWYSLRYGTMSIDQIVAQMQCYGYDTAVLTDINNSSGSLEFVKKCREEGLNALVGMEFRNEDELLYITIAKNNEGFEEINRHRTNANRMEQKLSAKAPEFKNVFVIYPFGKKEPADLRLFEYIGIQAPQLNKIHFEPRSHYERYVMWHPVTIKSPSEFKLHCQLRAIDHNLLISQLQRHQAGGREEMFIAKDALIKAYSAFPEIIAATEKLLSDCRFSFDFEEVKNKKNFFNSNREDRERLKDMALEGLVRRYGAGDIEARGRIEKELDIIYNQEFSSYFLITNDICQYARRSGYHHVGRGSGANSIVAYCLGITDVCPLKLNLYFERFLNPKRKIPPDFDVDFSWAVRDDMYQYIFNRYPDRVALLGAMSIFRSRSMMRELGKIYGLPKSEIDRMVMDEKHLLNKNEVVEMIKNVCNQMKDFPNQRTIHASGVLISELPLTYYSALDYPPKSLPTTQFDMHLAEKIGFEKFDILSQRGLGHIKDCIEIVKENKGLDIDITKPDRFFENPHIADQLRSANTIGCFYIESPAMRQLIAKLDCKDYLTLVAASSIIRPGVASSGMMGTYIERHHIADKNSISYLHPVMKKELEETYGVMVYQEDVMRIGHHYGGLDLGDADVLRRMMSGKARDPKRMAEIERKFFTHCAAMKYEEETSREIWRQMESFAGFSFNKAHSASYAVESYQSLYLKTYFPMEFMVSVLNNYGGFYQRKVYVNEVKRAGAKLNLPCVNHSRQNTTIKGEDVYLGYDCLLNLERQYVHSIPQELQENGLFRSLENFVLRTGISLEQLLILIRVGAFNFTGYGKKELLWEAHLLLSSVDKKKREAVLFKEEGFEKPILPKLGTSLIEDLYDELELIEFPVSGTMFDLVKTDFRGEVMAKDLVHYEGKMVRMVGDFVCDKTLNTKNGQLMKFGTFFDVEGSFFDTVHFSPSLRKYPFRGNGVYLILGKVVLDFGYPGIEVEKIARLPLWNDPRSV
ncbi:MAG: DNA polymerase III subunit alpha [Chitinophagaceae bacterium]|jgi:DNA polymerase-3 subunit alpha